MFLRGTAWTQNVKSPGEMKYATKMRYWNQKGFYSTIKSCRWHLEHGEREKGVVLRVI